MIPDGMLAKVAGDSRFKVGEGDKTWNELEFVQPDSIQLGGGLATDAQGKIYVDFSQMPTDKFEALLKSIYIPILLKQSTNFYVATTGSDVLDTGRGLSADKPFKTIQACIDYVTQNYNMGNYNTTINVAAGIYAESLILREYASNNGMCRIQGAPIVNENFPTIIDPSINNGTLFSVISSVSSNWEICYLHLRLSPTVEYSTASAYLSYNLISSNRVSNLAITASKLELDLRNLSNTPSKMVSAYIVSGGNGSIIGFNASNPINHIILHQHPNAPTGSASQFFWCSIDGHLKFNPSNKYSNLNFIKVEGDFTTFITLGSGSTLFSNRLTGNYYIQWKGTITNCKKFNLIGGSWINTGGLGTGWVPGDAEGTLDTNTFCWFM